MKAFRYTVLQSRSWHKQQRLVEETYEISTYGMMRKSHQYSLGFSHIQIPLITRKWISDTEWFWLRGSDEVNSPSAVAKDKFWFCNTANCNTPQHKELQSQCSSHNRDRWRTLVSAVMNLRVPWNAGNSLTSCKPVSSSRRTLHHAVSKSVPFLLYFTHQFSFVTHTIVPADFVHLSPALHVKTLHFLYISFYCTFKTMNANFVHSEYMTWTYFLHVFVKDYYRYYKAICL